MSKKNLRNAAVVLLTVFVFSTLAAAQEMVSKNERQAVRPMTIPISIFTNKELRRNQAEEFVEAGEIKVLEDGEEQVILSIKSVSDTPLSLAVLIQDDLSSEVNLQLSEIKKFIRNLPSGSRVMVAYLRGGKLDIRKKFTEELGEAADSLRIVAGSAAAAPRSPYDSVVDVLKRFDALPNGRRAILLISDGLDASEGINSSFPGRSIDLDKAIIRAQRKSVAIYSIYATGSITRVASTNVILNAQGSLNQLSHQTGGRAFFQGTFTAVSFDPFIKDIGLLLNRQFAVTYLSTHMNKGYHKVKVSSTNSEVRIEHPKGYFYRQ